MKLQIVLFAIAAIVVCSSSEKNKGRLSKTRKEQLLRNEKDNASRGRFLHKKGGGQTAAPAAPPTILVIDNQAPISSSSSSPSEDSFSYYVDFTGDVSMSPAPDSESRSELVAGDDDFVDSEDEVNNAQTSIRYKKRNNNLKLKKFNGKKQVKASEKSAPVINYATLKNGGNKLQKMFRLKENNRNSENIAVRRLFVQ